MGPGGPGWGLVCRPRLIGKANTAAPVGPECSAPGCSVVYSLPDGWMDERMDGARLLQHVPPARGWAESDGLIVPDESAVPLARFSHPLEQSSPSRSRIGQRQALVSLSRCVGSRSFIWIANFSRFLHNHSLASVASCRMRANEAPRQQKMKKVMMLTPNRLVQVLSCLGNGAIQVKRGQRLQATEAASGWVSSQDNALVLHLLLRSSV